jgi:hypothetical protein
MLKYIKQFLTFINLRKPDIYQQGIWTVIRVGKDNQDDTIINSLFKTGKFKSKSELSRLFEQGAVHIINNDKLDVDTSDKIIPIKPVYND